MKYFLLLALPLLVLVGCGSPRNAAQARLAQQMAKAGRTYIEAAQIASAQDAVAVLQEARVRFHEIEAILEEPALMLEAGTPMAPPETAERINAMTKAQRLALLEAVRQEGRRELNDARAWWNIRDLAAAVWQGAIAGGDTLATILTGGGAGGVLLSSLWWWGRRRMAGQMTRMATALEDALVGGDTLAAVDPAKPDEVKAAKFDLMKQQQERGTLPVIAEAMERVKARRKAQGGNHGVA